MYMYICDIALIQYIYIYIILYILITHQYQNINRRDLVPSGFVGSSPCSMAGDLEKHTVGLGMYYI